MVPLMVYFLFLLFFFFIYFAFEPSLLISHNLWPGHCCLLSSICLSQTMELFCHKKLFYIPGGRGEPEASSDGQVDLRYWRWEFRPFMEVRKTNKPLTSIVQHLLFYFFRRVPGRWDGVTLIELTITNISIVPDLLHLTVWRARRQVRGWWQLHIPDSSPQMIASTSLSFSSANLDRWFLAN